MLEKIFTQSNIISIIVGVIIGVSCTSISAVSSFVSRLLFNPYRKKRNKYIKIWELFLKNSDEFDEYVMNMDGVEYTNLKAIFEDYILPVECQGNNGQGFRVNSRNEQQAVKSLIQNIKDGDFDQYL